MKGKTVCQRVTESPKATLKEHSAWQTSWHRKKVRAGDMPLWCKNIATEVLKHHSMRKLKKDNSG